MVFFILSGSIERDEWHELADGYMIDSSTEYTLATKRFFKLTHSQPMFQF